jgi:beta-lactamase class A
MKLTVNIILLAFVSIFQLAAQNELPIRIPDSRIKPLRELLDKPLQLTLEKELMSRPEWRKLIAQKKMAVGVVDLSDPEHVRFARINGNYMMYAASLPKIAILLAAMDAIEKGELKETAEIKNDMRIMISKSDNQASTRMIDRLG